MKRAVTLAAMFAALLVAGHFARAAESAEISATGERTPAAPVSKWKNWDLRGARIAAGLFIAAVIFGFYRWVVAYSGVRQEIDDLPDSVREQRHYLENAEVAAFAIFILLVAALILALIYMFARPGEEKRLRREVIAAVTLLFAGAAPDLMTVIPSYLWIGFVVLGLGAVVPALRERLRPEDAPTRKGDDTTGAGATPNASLSAESPCASPKLSGCVRVDCQTAPGLAP